MRASTTGAARPLATSMAITALSASAPCLCFAQPASPSPAHQTNARNTSKRSSTSRCSGFIDGHVVDRVTHEPVAGATITVNGEDRDFSDEAGRFQLRNLCFQNGHGRGQASRLPGQTRAGGRKSAGVGRAQAHPSCRPIGHGRNRRDPRTRRPQPRHGGNLRAVW